MIDRLSVPLRRLVIAFAIAGPVAAPAVAFAGECAICDREVVLDNKLAGCFLKRYEVLQTRGGDAVIVDLTDCPEEGEEIAEEETSRGVIEALKLPQAAPETPNPKFMISRDQMACLRHRLRDGELALDPAARIALDDCE